MIKSFRLDLTFDRVRLQQDLAGVAEAARWLPHFNTGYYEGSWSGISLRSVGGSEESIYPDPTSSAAYHDTELMRHCEYIPEVLSALGCEVTSVRFLNLTPGTIIKTHRDHTLCYEDGEVRLHIPVQTNPDVEFISDGEALAMHEGECWYINASLPHSVANRGTSDRIHLVIDCIVNEELKKHFSGRAQSTERAPSLSEKDKAQMIAALQAIGTPASLQLIEQLQAS